MRSEACWLRSVFAFVLFYQFRETCSIAIRWERLNSDHHNHPEPALLDRHEYNDDDTDNSTSTPLTFNDERDGIGLFKKIQEIGHLFTMRGPPWYGHRGFRKPAYFHMHIPKAAGYSVIASSRDLLPNGTGLFSSEICFRDMRKLNAFYKGSGILTLVRRPTDHVYSQYWECAADDHFQGRIPSDKKKYFSNFTVWLKHFTEHKTIEDFGCYHPSNMQTRYFDCSFISCGLHHGCHFNGGLQPHSARKSDTNLDEAVRNMDSMFFVGLVEQYQVSMCVFLVKATNELPKWCDCENKEAWASFPNPHDDHRHNVPRHSVADITEDEQQMINRLTRNDAVLYERAEARFVKDVKRIEKRKGVKIMC